MDLHAGADFGSRAAAAGGVTTVMDMPLNQVPSITTGPLLQKKIAAVKVSLHSPAGDSRVCQSRESSWALPLCPYRLKDSREQPPAFHEVQYIMEYMAQKQGACLASGLASGT